MFSKSGDKDERGFTSFIREVFNQLSNSIESSVDPSNVISSILDFSFNKVFVLVSSFKGFLVGCNNLRLFSEGFSEVIFLCFVGDLEFFSLLEG